MGPTTTTLADVLVPWFRAHARDLPWRRPGTTAWGVLVSEIMLQQTPVARVEEPWRAWLERWPRPSAMAAAPASEVLRAWGKLGYPRRALRLHAAAQAIAADHGDVVPADVETLESLPGIGTYTARAVAAFAHGQRVPVVDTNVRRVVARAVLGRADAGAAASRDLTDTEALLPGDTADAATMSAALMELGATVCVARTPAAPTARCPALAPGSTSDVPPATVRRARRSAGPAPTARSAGGCSTCCGRRRGRCRRRRSTRPGPPTLPSAPGASTRCSSTGSWNSSPTAVSAFRESSRLGSWPS